MGEITLEETRAFVEEKAHELPFRALIFWTVWHSLLLNTVLIISIGLLLFATLLFQLPFSTPAEVLIVILARHSLFILVALVAVSYLIVFFDYGQLRYWIADDALYMRSGWLFPQTQKIRHTDISWIFVSSGEHISFFDIQSPGDAIAMLRTSLFHLKAVLQGFFDLYTVRIEQKDGSVTVLPTVDATAAQLFRSLRKGLGSFANE